MNSFILVSKDETKRNDYIDTFVKDNTISPFDKTVIQSDTASIGIELIRDMQKSIYFKPLKGEKKMFVIENAHTITMEAQNALLKVLEEPPLHTYFFLSAQNENAFLPTILSRCKLIVLEEEKPLISEEKEQEYATNFQQLTQGSIASRLAFAEKLASDKTKTQEWIEEMIYMLHRKMLENPQESREVVHFLTRLQEAYKLSQTTNVNLRLLLEHTFL